MNDWKSGDATFDNNNSEKGGSRLKINLVVVLSKKYTLGWDDSDLAIVRGVTQL